MNTLHKNQYGIAHLGIILAVVAVIAVSGAGYFVWSKQKNNDTNGSSATSEQSKAAAQECNRQMDDKDFCKFVSNFALGKEQRITMTGSDGTVTTHESDANGNTRTVSTQNGAEISAVISIGNASYIKAPGRDVWTKYTSSETPTQSTTLGDIQQNFDINNKIADNTTKYTKLGKEACGSLTCFKYEITDSTIPDGKTTLWFDDKDYKLRRMLSEGPSGTIDFAIEYSVSAITEPSPIEEAPDFQNMTPEQIQQYMRQNP